MAIFIYGNMLYNSMVKSTFELDEERDKKFRQAIANSKGLRKGALSEALQEAIDLWIKKQDELKKK
jgi:hypothetical protein